MNFDLVAPFYRFLEWAVFGRALERRRAALLAEVRDAQRILVIGEGDGRFLERLVAQSGATDIHVVEMSAAMLRLERERLGAAAGRVRFFHRDVVREGLPDRGYDLLVTHFVLDLYREQEIRRLVDSARALAPGCRWLVSEFRIPSGARPARWAAGAALWAMYRFFYATAGLRVLSLPDYPAVFRRAGLCLQCSRTAWHGFLASELWQFRGQGTPTRNATASSSRAAPL
jgi:ubiquinone/menaquinone biosynthesis C-methylase UbiE